MLSAKRNSDFLVAWAAARRAARAGHVSEMTWVARSGPHAAGRKKAMTGSVRSPLVATDSVGERVFKAGTMPTGRRSGHRGEVNWEESISEPVGRYVWVCQKVGGKSVGI